MEFKEFGHAESPKIVLIPGSMMCWKQFDKVIPLLAKRYRVITVSTDGFDGTGQTVFTTAEASVKKLADYLTEHHGGHIGLVFGESFGCATAATLFNSKAVQVDSMILNGAQYMDFGPLNQIIMHMIPRNQYRFVRKLEKADRKGKMPLMYRCFQVGSIIGALSFFAAHSVCAVQMMAVKQAFVCGISPDTVDVAYRTPFLVSFAATNLWVMVSELCLSVAFIYFVLKRTIPLPKAAVLQNTIGFFIILNTVSALLTSLTGNEIFTLLGKSGASLGMGAMFLAIACVCGKESKQRV